MKKTKEIKKVGIFIRMYKPKYKTLREWRKAERKAYIAATKKGLIEGICKKFGWKQPKKWDKKACLLEAKKHKTKSEWRKNHNSSYHLAYRNGWLDKCCKHMIVGRKSNNYWTLETCKKEAKKHKTKSEWYKNHSSSYDSAYKNSWLDECCQHMTKGRKPNGYWTLENCKKEAKKHKTKSEWYKKHKSSYGAAKNNGWLDECRQHMIEWIKPKGYWTLENCKKEAKKHKTRSGWSKKHKSSYDSAYRNSWLDECCQHMIEVIKHKGYWTLENCKKEASKHKTRKEWYKKHSSSYSTAQKNGWLDDCCQHMIEVIKSKDYWTKERCIENALLHKTRSEWKKKYNSSYDAAWRNGWLDECCKHMK